MPARSFPASPAGAVDRSAGPGGFPKQSLFGAFAPEMVERQVGGDPSRPGGEVTVRPELVASPVDAPESLHRQILRNARVAHDAHDPTRKYPPETAGPMSRTHRSRQAQIAGIDPWLLYCLLRDRKRRVTSFLMFAPTRGRPRRVESASQTGKCLSIGSGTLSTYVPHSEWMTRDLTGAKRLSGTQPLSAHLD